MQDKIIKLPNQVWTIISPLRRKKIRVYGGIDILRNQKEVYLMIDNISQIKDIEFKCSTEIKENEVILDSQPKIILRNKKLGGEITYDDILIDIYSNEVINGRQGLEDYRNKIIRGKTLENNPVDMLRTIRLAGELNFSIEEKTYETIIKESYLIKDVEPTKIFGELKEILLLKNPYYSLELMLDTGLLYNLIPEFKGQPDKVFHCFRTTSIIEPVLTQRLAALFHDISTDTSNKKHNKISAQIAKKYMKKFGANKNTTRDVALLIFYHEFSLELNITGIKALITKVNNHNVEPLINLKRADILAGPPDKIYDKIKQLEQFRIKLYKAKEELTW